MAIRDMVSTLIVRLSSHTVITGNGTTNGADIDTAGYDLGVSFVMSAPVWTDGTYKLTFQEGDLSDLSDATNVPADKIIPIAGLDAVNTGIAATVGQTDENDLMPRAGIHSTKRYVRAVVTATGVTSGATVEVVAVLGGEQLLTD